MTDRQTENVDGMDTGLWLNGLIRKKDDYWMDIKEGFGTDMRWIQDWTWDR